jgi:predicted dithiol-disulfide oxidoreductase (DUF899 family)
MKPHRVVSHEAWIEARKQLLAKEKEYSRMRDAVTAQRQALPWEKVEKDYTFEGPNGPQSLGELFEGRSQLIVYHFMFGPDWEEGCKICSMCADHYAPLDIHLKHRDVTMVTVSRAPREKLQAYRERMGWDFTWVSSFGSDFNWDYFVSFTPEQQEAGAMYYNYKEGGFPTTECPGISAFAKDEAGDIFHTYSSYARGLESFLGVYNLLDIVPKGRDESDLSYSMEWVQRHDSYGA